MHVTQEGVTLHDKKRATDGLVLFSPTQSQRAYLVDYAGDVRHSWDIVGKTLNSAMMLPNGNLWILERSDTPSPMRIGACGLMREYDWQGRIVWEHRDPLQHHDARRLPSGVIYLAWELLPESEAARLHGGVSGTEHADGIYSEVVREVDETGRIVWEWRASSLDYEKYPFHRNAKRVNYGHANSLDMLDDGNVLLSLKVMNLLLIIERGTGKLIWEFQDEALGGQHDVQMTDAGTVLTFANGAYATDLHHSSVWEIETATNKVIWKFTEKRNPMNFFSPHISGCQRLSSGNTLVCEGARGTIFETTPERDIVWHYVSPFWSVHPVFAEINWIFRARHYGHDSPEIQSRV